MILEDKAYVAGSHVVEVVVESRRDQRRQSQVGGRLGGAAGPLHTRPLSQALTQ